MQKMKPPLITGMSHIWPKMKSPLIIGMFLAYYKGRSEWQKHCCLSSSSSSIPQSRGSLGHHRWFCNHFFFSIFPCSPLPSWTCRTPGLMLSSHLFLCPPCLLPPFTVPCKMVLARPDERETWPYHCSLPLFTMVRRSSCGPVACWILARTSSLVTWSLYEMYSILR